MKRIGKNARSAKSRKARSSVSSRKKPAGASQSRRTAALQPDSGRIKVPGKTTRATLKSILVGMLHDGSRPATIEELLDPEIQTRTCKELSLDEMKKLSLHRIRKTEVFIAMRMLGVPSVIDKSRALKEIAKLSPIGMHLLEIEKRHIGLQIERHRRKTTD